MLVYAIQPSSEHCYEAHGLKEYDFKTGPWKTVLSGMLILSTWHTWEARTSIKKIASVRLTYGYVYVSGAFFFIAN